MNNRHTNGHGDSITDPSQRAESVNIVDSSYFGCGMLKKKGKLKKKIVFKNEI